MKRALIIFIILMFSIKANCQQSNNRDSSLTRNKNYHGILKVPNKFISDFNNDIFNEPIPFKNNFNEVYSKFFLESPKINLHLNFFNPKEEYHPFIYSLLKIGGLLNNKVVAIQKEQMDNVMNSVYGTMSLSTIRNSQYNIKSHLYNDSKITVSGYRANTPELDKTSGHNKP